MLEKATKNKNALNHSSPTPGQHLLLEEPEAFQCAGQAGEPLVSHLAGWEAELLVAYARKSPADWRLLCSDVSPAPPEGLKSNRDWKNALWNNGTLIQQFLKGVANFS